MLKKINLRLVILACITIGAFLWVSVRPYMDRKHCYDYAVKQVEGMGGPQNDRLIDLYQRHYLLCVNSRGLDS
jgi:hypothetical protein